jgi:hypothetical protein
VSDLSVWIGDPDSALLGESKEEKMPRKNSIHVSITLVLATALIAQLCIVQKAMCMESLKDVAPDEPLLFFQLTGAASMLNMDSNLWKQVAEAPFMELLYAEIEAATKVKDIHLAIEPGVSLLSRIFGEDIVFVLPKFGQIMEVSPLLMLRLKDADDALGEIIASGIRIAMANAAKATSQYGGYTIAMIPMRGDAPVGISCALLDDVFAVGLGDKTLKGVIDLMNGSGDVRSIMEDGEFSSIMKRLPTPDNSKTGKHLSVFYVDVAEISAFVSGFYPLAQGNIPPQARPVAEKMLGLLDLVSSVGSASSITDEGIVSQGYMMLNPDADMQNIMEMLQVEPEKLGSMEFAPADAMGYSGSNLIDLKLIWEMVISTLAGLPQMGDQMLGKLEQAQQQLGFNLEEDLFSWMGNEMAYIYNESPAFSEKHISQELCWIIEVTDEEKAANSLQKLTGLALGLANAEGGIQPREYGGQTIHEMGNLPVPITPGYALVDNYLLISLSTDYMEKLIDCAAGKSKGLEANPRFRSVKAKLPNEVNSMQFADFPRYAGVLIDSVKAQTGGEMPSWDDEDLGMEETVMLQVFELASILSQAFGASVSYTISDGTSLEFNSLMQMKDLESVTPIPDPDVARIARNVHIANRYKEAGMHDRALDRYMQALELDEGNWQANAGAADILKQQDRVQEAAKYWAHTGFALEDAWHVIGPFQNEGGEGFDIVFPPEEGIQLDAEYEGKSGMVRWEKRDDGTLDGFVDLQRIYDVNQWTVAYAWAKVMAEETREVELRVGSDDQIIVWLNGEEILRHGEPRQAQLDQDVIPVTMKQGENQLLVKVCNEMIDWGFYLRFTDTDGEPLKGLEYVNP